MQNILNFFTKYKKNEIIQERLNEQQSFNDYVVYRVNNQKINSEKLSSYSANSVDTISSSEYKDNKVKLKLIEEENLKKAMEEFSKKYVIEHGNDLDNYRKSLINQK